MKRILRLKLIPILLVFMILLALPMSAGAKVWESHQAAITNSSSVGIATYWDATSQIFHDLTIGGGSASTGVSYYTWNRTDKVYLTTTLEKMSGTTATAIKSWTGSGTGSAFTSGSYSVSSGSYRLKVTGTVYDHNGKHIETVTVYSGIKHC